MKNFKQLLLARKGGKTTVKIIDILLEEPKNINQLSKTINMDYNTVKYHINILLRNELIYKIGDGYGTLYEASQLLIDSEEKYITTKNELIHKKKL